MGGRFLEAAVLNFLASRKLLSHAETLIKKRSFVGAKKKKIRKSGYEVEQPFFKVDSWCGKKGQKMENKNEKMSDFHY